MQTLTCSSSDINLDYDESFKLCALCVGRQTRTYVAIWMRREKAGRARNAAGGALNETRT